MLARKNKSQRSLADDLGVSVPWLNYRLTCTQEITLNDAERIATALGVPVAELLPAGLLAEEPVAGAA